MTHIRLPINRTLGTTMTVTALVLALLTAGCGSPPNSPGASVQAAGAPTRIVHIDASWATYYTDMASLKKSSDLAVTAMVVKQYPSVRIVKVGSSGGTPVETTIPATDPLPAAVATINPNPARSASGGSNTTRDQGYMTTDFDLSINTRLVQKGGVTSSKTVRVTQTGGVDSTNTEYETSDDPLFKLGDQVALFLIQYAPGKFRVSGGPSGRFSVSNGKISAIVKDGVPVSQVSTASFVNVVASS